MLLTELEAGKKARILDVSQVSRVIQRRLLDLGVDEGTMVAMKGWLPFRGPCMLEVAGQRISLRRKEASSIHICVEEA